MTSASEKTDVLPASRSSRHAGTKRLAAPLFEAHARFVACSLRRLGTADPEIEDGLQREFARRHRVRSGQGRRRLGRHRRALGDVAGSAQGKRPQGDLRLEVIALDEVRRTTERQRPRDALALLDAYTAKFPAGKLRAAVLRIEALHASGNPRAAEALARRLLRESPKTPYAARVSAALVDPLEQQ